MPREALKGRAPRAASVHERGDSGVDAPQVGVDAIAGEALEDMRMQVNQAGGNDRPGDLQDARRLLAGDRWRDLRYGAVLDCNVVSSVKADRWVHHGTAFEDEIVHGSSPV